MVGTEPNMSQENDQSVSRPARHRRPVFGILTAALLLGGCSAVPDWADPTDWFAKDVAPTRVGLAEGQARSQPTGFPNLASVPNQPPKILSPEARAEVQAGLAADRANAVYSGEKLTGSTPIPASATQAVSDAPPAPKISNELTAAMRVPPAPSQTQVAQTQVAQTEVPQVPVAQVPVAQTQVAQASGGQTQLRFPQFQNLQPRAGTAPLVAAPAIAAVPSAVGVQLVAVIYFGHGSSQLDGEDRAVLRDVVTLGRQRGGRIRVIGHASAHTAVTDQITHDLTNFEISLERANSVAAELIALGAARDQVRAEARSDKQPVYHEFMSTGQAGNRRVEIFLEY
jgi:outer membrane protein OmpA-like peptidoglycan-associated protein